jgi:uncharacterized protein
MQRKNYHMTRLILSITLVMLLCTWASAESMVWKAQKGNSVIYLGGTFHILRESDFPLPPEFEKAYKASEVVVFETEIDKFKDPATQQKLMAKATYADGSTIEKHLSPKTYRELSEYCVTNGIPLQQLARFKPSMLITTLTFVELMKLGVTQHGVDEFFYEKAKEDGKAVKGLETVDEQIDYVVSMADGDEDGFVRYSIRDMGKLKPLFEEFETAWRKGDADKLDRLLNVELKAEQPKLYDRLMVGRTRKWLPLIDAPQKPPRTQFILVGAGHLVGPDGLVEELRKKGYKVEKL